MPPGRPADQPQEGIDSLEDRVVVTATRLPVAEDQSPAAVTVIPADELAQRQTDRVADALRAVPGVSVSQSGAPGQLTSVFTRGLNSDQTQVLIDGIPFNQGLAGQFNFADLTGDGIERIEVERGPQSTVYGPRAAAGTIQLFTRRGDELDPTHPFSFDASSEGGSFGTYRERVASAGVLGLPQSTSAPASKDGKDGGKDSDASASSTPATPGSGPGVFDYSLAFSRLDTDNQRPNNEYRNTAVLANLGFAPRALTLDTLGGTAPRLGVLVLYSNSDASSPNTIFDPAALDNLLTERQLYAPNIDWQLTRWWHHRLVLEYDKERQVNNPNDVDPFTGPTRGTFYRYQLDYQNDVQFTHWLTLTSGVFYENVLVSERRPFVSQAFGPAPTYLSDFTSNAAVFGQVSLTPVKNLLLVAGGRYDHFNLFGDQGSYRVAGSYLFERTGTTIRSSVATGFSPPDPQDRIFASNPGDLDPAHTFGYDAGFEQGLLKGRLRFGANYFHNDLSNVIGFNSVTFETLNLGSARTEGLEAFAQWEPVTGLLLRGTYTYLDAVNTSSGRYGNLARGARLPRRPRNEAFLSVGYRWPGVLSHLSTTLEAKIVNGREDVTFNAAGNAQNFDLGGYTNLRFLASYAVTEHVSAFFRIENVTNTSYQEVYGYPALTRGFFGGLAVHY